MNSPVPATETTAAHFLNHGKWDDSRLEDTLKQTVIDIIYHEAAATGKPVFRIVGDTISSHTKPSSKALHPIEDAYFHQSCSKRKQDYGHQVTGVSLTTEEIPDAYVERWPIKLFFRQSKGKLAPDKYQIRSSKGIRRYWLIMSLVHLLCCTKTGEFCSFEDGYARLQQEIQRERICISISVVQDIAL